MNNQQILKKRWKKTDQILKKSLPKYRSIYQKIGDDVIDIFRQLDISYDKANKKIPLNLRRQVNRKIDEWKKQGIVNGYFAFLISSLKYTYSKVLEILIYGIYLSANKEVYKTSKKAFKEISNDCYSQGLEDLKKEKEDFPWTLLAPLMFIPIANATFEDYLIALSITYADEMYKAVNSVVMQGQELDVETVLSLVSKQSNRLLKINDEHSSGVIDTTARAIGNSAYVEAGKKDNEQALFIAELDDATTKMCKSLDGQIFNTNDWNRYYRYSEADKKEVLYTTFGLVQGQNLPPIDNHFHWCRSTITYQTELSREEIDKRMGRMGSKESSDSTKASKYYSFKKQFDLDLEKSKDPKVKPSDKIVVNGVTYEGDDVIPNTNKAGEYEGAEFLRKTFDVDVKLMPEVKQRKNVKKINSYDYLVDNSDEPWDCKAGITSTSKEVFKNNISQKQATSYLFDIRNCKYEDGSRISDAYVDEIVDYTFKTRKYVNCIVVKDSNKLVGVYYNKKG